jgi:hypothetical protein
MKRCAFAFLFIFLCTLSASAGMVRVVEVVDGRTIVVDDNGHPVTVTLGGVAVPEEEAAEAVTWLKRLVLGQWVLVEAGGVVYRSPDALLVNNEMSRHAWRGIPRFVYLGTIDGPTKGQSKVAPKTAAATPVPKVSQKPGKRPHALPNLTKSQRGVTQKQPGRG